MNQVFFYGTLKKEETSRSHWLEDNGIRLLSLGVLTPPKWCMRTAAGSGFPALFEGNMHIKGDLYEFDSKTHILAILDRIEGVDSGLFARINLDMGDGNTTYGYVAGQTLLSMPVEYFSDYGIETDVEKGIQEWIV